MAITQKISMIGLVSMDVMKSGAPIISLRLVTAAKSSMICRPTSPMLVPSPVISAVNCPCKVTDSS